MSTVCEELLYAYIQSIPAITDIIGTRMYPVIRPQTTQLPALSYQRVAETRVDPLTAGAPGAALTDVRMQIDHWAASYATVKDLAVQVRQAMNGHNQASGLRAMSYLTAHDEYDDESRTYRVSADYSIWVEED
jgi:hypothetical protein